MSNAPKEFEARFKKDWASTVPDSFCYRLIDAMSGYKSVANVSDFICYKKPDLYVIDCKMTSKGNTINFADIRQYDLMVQYMGISGVHLGIIWWNVQNEKIVWVPIETLYNIKQEGKKSYNIKMLGDPNYPSLEIPSKKLRTFLTSDYSALIDYYKES